jgi:hypothetical protein
VKVERIPPEEITTQEGVIQVEAEAGGRDQDIPLYCMFHERDIDDRMRDCPIFLESKKKMTKKQNQHPNPSTAKEVNHTSHWHQPLQSSFSNQPSYQHHNTCSEYQPNYHRYPSLASITNPTTTDSLHHTTGHITAPNTQVNSMQPS